MGAEVSLWSNFRSCSARSCKRLSLAPQSYPHLERIAGKTDMLAQIMAPHAK
jgi:hypothetical protein